MRPAEHRGEGRPRPFRADELASMRSVADSRPELMLDDPAIQGDRSIRCECGHRDVAEHNTAVGQILRSRAA